MADLEYEDIQHLLSRPAASVRARSAGGRSCRARWPRRARRRCCRRCSPARAGAAAPIGDHDGILVLIQCGGGNDGLNTLCPIGDPAYRSARPRSPSRRASALTIAPGFGLHPSLPKLKARYDQGKVAIVRGVGQTNNDLSHFSSTANWMAGTHHHRSLHRLDGALARRPARR